MIHINETRIQEAITTRANQVNDITQKELKRQDEQWLVNIGPCLSVFKTEEIETGFFAFRKTLRKRCNISLEDSGRGILRAPNNIPLRVPVAIKKESDGYIMSDLRGTLPLRINKAPNYEIPEDQIYIIKMVKHYPMYPYLPVLNENANGLETELIQTFLPLYARKEENSIFNFLSTQPSNIETEGEAIERITEIQNYYRLRGCKVERKSPDSLAVAHIGPEEPFVVKYSSFSKCLKVGLILEK